MNPWQSLSEHFPDLADIHLEDLFASDPDRSRRYAIELEGLYLDYSKHRINDETLSLLINLAQERGLKQWTDDLFNGAAINTSERRPALHTALRNINSDKQKLINNDVSAQVAAELDHINTFISGLHAGRISGYTGKTIKTLVNIGIGGSDLGPRLVCDALAFYRTSSLEIRFAANIDADVISHVLTHADPETTLFIISSKSFSTEETLTNANAARNWLLDNGCTDLTRHFVAVTANQPAAEKFGITSNSIFNIWDWVGGRYSVWSATGLPVAASIGMDNFLDFLDGARYMDEHFRTEPFARNIPVLLGLLDIWYINFFNTESLAIVPYAESLRLLPNYIAQLMMESNGKSVDVTGRPVEYKTGAVVWGGVGTNAQHAFMQLLHQGTHLVPVEFIVALAGNTHKDEHQKILFANCIAQGEALMTGNCKSGQLPGYKIIAGNKPSTTIICEKLTPRTLGMLLAMYEHRTFVQACIWQINPFDQWGVELGKQISKTVRDDLDNSANVLTHDPSTIELINRYREYYKQK
jgi:glucose-6-phosphate isomerase